MCKILWGNMKQFFRNRKPCSKWTIKYLKITVLQKLSKRGDIVITKAGKAGV